MNDCFEFFRSFVAFPGIWHNHQIETISPSSQKKTKSTGMLFFLFTKNVPHENGNYKNWTGVLVTVKILQQPNWSSNLYATLRPRNPSTTVDLTEVHKLFKMINILQHWFPSLQPLFRLNRSRQYDPRAYITPASTWAQAYHTRGPQLFVMLGGNQI